MDQQPPVTDPTPAQMDSETFRQALLGLTSEDINQRIEAVRILGLSRRIEAVKPLRQAFRDGGNILRSYARQALERLQEDLQLERLTLVDDMSETPAGSSQEGSPPPRRLNMEKLREHLESNDPKIRIGVAQAAAQFQEKGLLPELVDRLDREYHLFVIASLLLAIGKLGGDDELDVLYPYLKHDDERIRANALEAIQHTGSRKVDLTRVLPLVNDPAERVANNAARLVAMFDSNEVGKTLDRVQDDPEMRETASVVNKLRGDKPRPTTPAVVSIPPHRRTPPWIALTITALIILGAIAFFFLRPAPPPPEIVTTPVETAGPDPAVVRSERLKELETLLQEDKLNRAEILLRTALKEDREDPLTRLLAGDFLVRRKLWLKAGETLADLQPPAGRENHLTLLLAQIDLGLDNTTAALRRLKELVATRKADRWSQRGQEILDKLLQRFKEEDAQVIQAVQTWLKQWFAFLSGDLPPQQLESLIEDPGLRRSVLENLRLERADGTGWQSLRISSEVRLERNREGPRIIAECLELQLGRIRGGLPGFIPQHRIYTFRYGLQPTLINLDHASEPGIMAGEPLAGLAAAWALRNRNLKEALEKLDLLLNAYPDHGYIQVTAAETRQSLRQSSEIISQLAGNIDRIRFQPPHPLGDDLMRGELYDLLANARRDTGDHEGYARDLKEAARLAPAHSRILVERMALAQENNQTEEWEKAYQQALAAEPDYPFLDQIFFQEMFAEIIKVRELIEKQNFRDAMNILTTMRQKNSDYWRIFAETGEIFFRLERSDQAITQFEQALRRNPAHPGLMRRLALCYLQNEEFEDARKWADKALEQDPSETSRKLLEKVTRAKNKE